MEDNEVKKLTEPEILSALLDWADFHAKQRDLYFDFIMNLPIWVLFFLPKRHKKLFEDYKKIQQTDLMKRLTIEVKNLRKKQENKFKWN